MLINEVTKDGAAISPVTGLYDAKVGDIIEIGVEGSRNKQQTKIAKATPTKVTDSDGNIFLRSGMIYRRSGFQASVLAPGKKVYAKLVTQKQLDKSHDKDRRNYLSKQDWNKIPADKIEKILKIMNVSFGDAQKLRRYHEGE